MPEQTQTSSDPSAEEQTPLTSEEYVREYYRAQWQQYYDALWQQYYAQQAYGNEYASQEAPQAAQYGYSHGGHLENLPSAPREIENSAKEVFVSYSTKNPKEAAFVCKKLEASGLRCWIAPRDLLPGTNFADNIEVALSNAKLLVLILSKASIDSPWVEGEVNTAFSAGMPILVYKIDNVKPTGSLRVMLEKFPTLVTSGNAAKDAKTLVYNAMILAGRIAHPGEHGGVRATSPVSTAASPGGVRKVSSRNIQVRRSAPPHAKSTNIALIVIICLICVLATILSAPLWFPTIQSVLPSR